MDFAKKFFFLLVGIQIACFGSNSPQESCKKKALIFGVTGQDGHYMVEFLLEKGYEVHGVCRRSSSSNTSRIDGFLSEHPDRFFVHLGDLSDGGNIFRLIQEIQPDEIYNLAAQSMVKDSFEIPEYTAEVNALGTLRILESIKSLGLTKKTKFYQASTSELYGLVKESPQNEETYFHPRSPYAVSKLFAYWTTVNYRESYGIFACNGILFNHESPMRGESFVTRKITQAVARIKLGTQDILYLGNLDAKRDWGYAKDYVEAMWQILQQDVPRDFVVATGETHSVREFTECSFRELGIDIEWKGKSINEQGINKKTGEVLVKIDPEYFRPSDVDALLGDSKKAKAVFQWEPKTKFHELVGIMVRADYEQASNEITYAKFVEHQSSQTVSKDGGL